MVATLHSIPVHLSKSQIKSMVMGGAVNITPSMISNDAKHLLEVGTQTAKKIHSHLVKGKGLRVCLKPNEDISEMKSGGKISLKSIGHSISNAFTHPSQTAKTAAHYLIPAATGALGAAAGSTLGGPLGGVAGSALGSYAGHQLDNKLGVGVRKRGRPKKGKGVFKTIKNVFGVNKGDAINMAKSAGKTALKGAAAATGAAIGAASENPLLGAAAATAIEAMGGRLIDTIDSKTNVKSLGRDASKISRDVALSSAESYIDKNVSNPTEKAMINRVLQKDYPSQAELVGAVAPRLSMGRGIRIKKGKGAMMSPDYITAMKYIEGSGVSNSTNIKPMTDVMTLSPYANTHSPQMNPFIGSAGYQSYRPLANKAIGKKFGGSIYPAGSYGGAIYGGDMMSFMPAG
jgi:hypothetical protein